MRPMVNHDRVESERAEVVDLIRHVQFYNYSQSRCRLLTKMEKVAKEVEPKRLALREAEENLNRMNAELAGKQAQLQEVVSLLTSLSSPSPALFLRCFYVNATCTISVTLKLPDQGLIVEIPNSNVAIAATAEANF